MTGKNKKLIKAVIAFLIIWIGGFLISVALDIRNGLLPSFFLGSTLAIWYYKHNE